MKLRSLALLLLVGSAPSGFAQDLPSSEAPRAGADLSGWLSKAGSLEDGRRTLGAFPKNLGRSFIGVFSKDNLVPFLAGATATGAGSFFDGRASDALVGKVPGLSSSASSAGSLAVTAPATLGLFVAGRFTHDTRFRAFSYDLTQALVVDAVYTELIKKAVHRTRPDGSDALSFPSGHSSTAFALATVAEKHYGWKLGVPSYLAASVIGFSRISNDKHYLSDVLAGASLGIITGRTVVHKNGEVRGRQRSFSLSPATDPQGGGVGIGASLTW